ncbi:MULTISPECIES: hypothetical protein [Brucella]|uniref:Uncharacterized protein n=2 Tax=Brucella TaxID=234 RepID=A0AAE9INM2_BRUAO|nr:MULTISPECIES: hypothetical protein [Brucella]AZH17231.1 hypothetical protein EHE09_12635 [Brucella melitensis]AZS92465.1 hypothetical protein EIA50_11855 [Brucella abortus]MBC3772499.1 hypothetical protein [Brucella melitensis]MBH9725525.1 hypothetical protein [Brucella abortus]MBH9728383.1 hypothetical protein [Brucella abortus]
MASYCEKDIDSDQAKAKNHMRIPHGCHADVRLPNMHRKPHLHRAETEVSVVEMKMLGRFNHRVAALPQRPANSFFPDKTVYSARPVQLRVTFFGCN